MKIELNFEDLKKKLKNNFNESELEEIKTAYDFAEESHRGKTRLTNEPYITHPLNVALILSDLNVDKITIMGALLHEVLNNGNTTEEELEETFGSELANIVKTISTINKLELTDDKESSAIYLRKVLVGLAEDVRVLFIKLADRLHNMRTIWAVRPEKQKRKANETMNVLIPIAHRLGIYGIKSELEDLCLRYLKPEVYEDILKQLDASVEELEQVLVEMQDSISEILIENGIKFHIKSRVKSVYSIYKKLSTWRKWSDIYDILALRIIVEKESDCYLAIGLIHSKFRPMAKRFKDYIAMPKENMYQSLHTGIVGIDGHIFEVQVRTYEMDEIAEKGIASHFSYKEKGTKKIQSMMEQKLEFFRNMIEAYKESDDLDFATNVNNDILGELIYVFTPKGDVVELPKGATPIDFAYRIHSKVGDTTVGAIVNEEIVPLSYELKDNDVIKINTNKSSTPSKEWLDFVKTSGAKSKIKSYFSKQDRADYIENGKNILERELRKQKLAFNEVFDEEKLEKLYHDLKVNDIEEIYLAIGSFRYTAGYIIKLTTEEKHNVTDALIEKVSNKNKYIPKSNNKNDIIVGEYNDILITLAKCCKPVKGDDIIGYITKGEGITVHKCDCTNVTEKTERLIDVSWSEESENDYFTDIYIETLNDKNYVGDIINKASVKNISVVTLNTSDTGDTSIYNLTIKVKNTTELNDFLNSLYSLAFVKKVGKK